MDVNEEFISSFIIRSCLNHVNSVAIYFIFSIFIQHIIKIKTFFVT